ncbi:cytoplasmic dynein heavy chain, putative [Babesia caballi]|uniref:Dynein heavy chain, cytoplasmic n=1 Tax=Babesia caballi TaxID=5871 RepID=A0AAV4LSG3_BABCB|nr:cytoplasmic dynein heavy chain, putative [Babesia caballi]
MDDAVDESETGTAASATQSAVRVALKNVAALSATYFNIDADVVARCLRVNEDVVIQALFGDSRKSEALVVTARRDGGTVVGDSIEVHCGWDNAFEEAEYAIGFVVLDEAENSTEGESERHECNVVPFVWKRGASPAKISRRLLKSFVCPWVENEKNACANDDKRHGCLSEALNGINRLCATFHQLETGSTIRHANINVGAAISKVATYMGKDAKDWNIGIPSEVMLEDIKRNVVEWSVEIARILGLYAVALKDGLESEDSDISYDIEEEVELSDSVSESHTLSNYSTPVEILTENESDGSISNGSMEEGFSAQPSNASSVGCDRPMDIREEVDFWVNYEDALVDLYEKMQSTTVEYTLGLLEFNMVEVENIYCFGDALETASDMVDCVKKINILMKGFPLDALKDAKSADELKSAMNTVLKHLERIKHVRRYSSRKLTEMIMGLTLDISHACCTIFHRQLRSVLDGEQLGRVIKSLDGCLQKWEYGLGVLKTRLEAQPSTTITFSTKQALSLQAELRSVLRGCNQCTLRHKILVKDVEILMQLRRSLANRECDNSGLKKPSRKDVKLSVELVNEFYRQFLVELRRKMSHSEEDPPDLKSITQCVQSFIGDLTQVETLVKDCFGRLICHVNALEGVQEILSCAKKLSVCRTQTLPSDTFRNIMKIILDEVRALEVLYEAGDNGTSIMTHVPIPGAAQPMLDVARVNGKLMAVENILVSLEQLVGLGSLQHIQYAVDTLTQKINRHCSAVDVDFTAALHTPVFQISDDNGRYFESIVTLPYNHSMEDLMRSIYMPHLGITENHALTLQMETIPSLACAIRSMFAALSAMAEHNLRSYDSTSFSAMVEPPREFLDMLKNLTWEELVKSNKGAYLFEVIHSNFVAQARMAATTALTEDVLTYASTLTVDELCLTAAAQVRQIVSCNHTNMSCDCRTHTGHFKEQLEKIISNWQKEAITRWTTLFSDGSLPIADCAIQLVEEDDEIFTDPPLDEVRQRLYNHLGDSTNLPQMLIDEISSVCPIACEAKVDEVNDLMDRAQSAIHSTVTHLEDHLNRWKDFEVSWQAHFENRLCETTDLDTLIGELDEILRSSLTTKTELIAPLKLSIPDEVHKRKLESLQGAVIQLICDAALESVEEMKMALPRLAGSLGLEHLIHNASTLSPSSSSTSWNSDNKTDGEIKTAAAENNFDYSTFTLLVEELKAERSDVSGVAELTDCYVQTCISLGPFLQTLYGSCIAKSDVAECHKEWMTLVDNLRNIEHLCRSRNCRLPRSWTSSHKVKRYVLQLASAAESISETLLQKAGQTVSELPAIYSRIQNLIQLQWEKARDKIDAHLLDYDRVISIIEEIECNWTLVKSQLFCVSGILKATSTTPDSSQDVSIESLTAPMEEILEYGKHWSYAKGSLLRYESILNSEVTAATLPKLRYELGQITDDLISMGHVWKVISPKIGVLDALLNGTIGSCLGESAFTERVISSIKETNILDVDSYQTCLTVKQWLHVYDAMREDLKEIVRLLEFQKTVKEYIDGIRKKWVKIDVLWKQENLALRGVDGSEATRNKLWKLQNAESLLYYIDDCSAFLHTYKSSKYAEEMKAELDDWLTRFTESKNCIENWIRIEYKLSYISNIFSSSTVQVQLDKQACALKELIEDDQQSAVMSMKRLSDTKNCASFLQKMMDVIGDLEHALRLYLDERRFVCPRYFFLRDEELFRVLGTVNLEHMEQHISKMFPGIAGLLINGGSLCGIISKESEVMTLGRAIPLTDADAEFVLQELDREIKVTLQSQILSSVQELEVIYSLDAFDAPAYSRWMEHYVSQVLIISLCILWTRSMETIKVDSEVEELQLLLDRLISNSSKSLTTSDSAALKLEQTSIFLIYQLQKTQSLGKIGVCSCFWQNCIRYYLNDSGTVELRIGPKTYPYGYEVMGGWPNLILTSLTEKCFTSISEAMDSCLIGNPQGPAGTGKTESVKAMATLCGYPFLVFNCNEDFDSGAMERNFAGLCQLGAWGIFDEFNRLSEGVLSAIAEIAQRVVLCQKNRTNRIRLLGRNVELNGNVGIFVTINPGYLSRSSFPLNMKMLCRPIVMEAVKLNQVIYVLLKLSGMPESSTMASVLWNILNCCQLCFSDSIYDFGLRCSKQVLCHLRLIIRSIREERNDIPLEHTEGILERALWLVLSPRFPSAHVPTLRLIVRSCLASKPSTPFEYICPSLSDRGTQFMTFLEAELGAGLECSYIKEKAFELFNFLGTSVGIILYGPTGCGKTLCLTATLKAINAMDGSEYEVERFDPNALDGHDTYGQFTKGEWLDGLFTHLMRKYTDSDRNVIIVFDGDIDSSWVESMNSVLDDSMVLTLNNGNRIQLTPNITILFETDSLKYVTPATMSRCALVRFEMVEQRFKFYGNSLYLKILEPDVLLFRYDLFRSLYRDVANSSSFLFAFVNSFGSHLGFVGYAKLTKKADAVSHHVGGALLSHDESEKFVLESFQGNKLECIVSLLLRTSMSFVLRKRSDVDVAKLVTQVAESLGGWFIVSLYLSKGCGYRAIMEVLHQHSRITKQNSQFIMSPKENSEGATKMLLLLSDTDYQSTSRANDTTFWPFLRRILQSSSFWTRGGDDANWITVGIKNISIVVVTNSMSYETSPQRLRRILPAINSECLISGTKIVTDCHTPIFDIPVDGCAIDDVNQAAEIYQTVRRHLKAKGAYMSYRDLSIFKAIMLEFNFDPKAWWMFEHMLKYKYGYIMDHSPLKRTKSQAFDSGVELMWPFKSDLNKISDFKEISCFMKFFFESSIDLLSVTGGNMHLRKLICQEVSACSGYSLVQVDCALWASNMVEILRNAGLDSERICVFVDWDLLVLQSPGVLGQLKNMVIQRDYSTIMGPETIKQLQSKNPEYIDEDYEDFRMKFFRNIELNIKYIFSSRLSRFDESILNMGLCVPMPRLSSSFMSDVSKVVFQDEFGAEFSKVYNIFIGLFGGKSNLIDYLLYLRLTGDLMAEQVEEYKSDYDYLLTGIKKIERAQDEVSSMRQTLDSRRSYLLTKNEEAEIKVAQITALREESALKQQEAEDLTVSLENEKQILIQRSATINHKLAEVEPLIEQAQQDVESINRKSLDELRSMRNPPSVIKYTVETVVILLTNSRNAHVAWDLSRKVLKSSDFISRILNFDAKTIDRVTFDIVKSRLAEQEWDIQRISNASRAAGPLAKWVASVINYAEIAIHVRPLLDELEDLKSSNVENEGLLAAQSEIMENLEYEITQYEKDYTTLTASIASMQSEINVTSCRIEKSESLLSDLAKEVDRWKESVTSLESRHSCLKGNAILEASMAVLSGYLDASKRDEFYGFITQVLLKSGMSYSYDYSSILNFDRQILQANLPYRHCMLVDSPDMLYPSLTEGSYKVVSACDQHFMAVLSSAKECKLTLIIKDIVYSPLSVKRGIFNDICRNDGGDEFNILLPISSEDLRRCKALETEDDHYILNISELCLTLHLRMSHHTFESYCADILMKEIDPKLYGAHEEVKLREADLRNELRKKEYALLGQLVSTDDILEDETAAYIAEYKRECEVIQGLLRGCAATQDGFRSLMAQHSGLTSLLSAIYSVMTRLGKLNAFYFFDLSLIVDAMKLSCATGEREAALIKLIFRWINQALFAEDRAFWAFELLSLYCTYVNDDAELRRLVNEASQSDCDPAEMFYEIERMKQKHLCGSTNETFGVDTTVFDYFNMIIITTKGSEDPAAFVESYARAKGRDLRTLAMCAPSETAELEAKIQKYISKGFSLLLKNAHLSTSWFKKFESQFPLTSDGPKIFVTWDSGVHLDRTILMRRYRFVYQGAETFQSTLHQLLGFCGNLLDAADRITTHLMLKTVLVHAIVIRRQLYIPYGWTRSSMFDNNDLLLSLRATVEFEKHFRHSLDNLGDFIRDFHGSKSLIGEWRQRVHRVYAAKISTEVDELIMWDILAFTDPGVYPLHLPSEDVLKWIQQIPTVCGPCMIGLPDCMDQLMLRSKFRRLREFVAPIKMDDMDIERGTVETFSFPEHTFDDAQPLLVAALRGQWADSCRDYGQALLLEECRKLIKFEESNEPVIINLNVFSEPAKLLDILTLVITGSSGMKADDLELIARPIPATGTLDHVNTVPSTNCGCHLVRERLILDRMELVGATCDFETSRLSIPGEATVETRAPIRVVLQWMKRTCGKTHQRAALPIYNSRRKLNFTLNFALDCVNALIYLRNVRVEGLD